MPRNWKGKGEEAKKKKAPKVGREMRSQNHKRKEKGRMQANATTAKQSLASDRHLAGAVDWFESVASSRRRHRWQICECAERGVCVRV